MDILITFIVKYILSLLLLFIFLNIVQWNVSSVQSEGPLIVCLSVLTDNTSSLPLCLSYIVQPGTNEVR